MALPRRQCHSSDSESQISTEVIQSSLPVGTSIGFFQGRWTTSAYVLSVMGFYSVDKESVHNEFYELTWLDHDAEICDHIILDGSVRVF